MGEIPALAGRNWPALTIGLVSGLTRMQPVDGRPTSCSLASNFVRVAPDGTESCWPCPTCPEGQGLTPQCGTKISTNTTIGCELCEPKTNYSDIRDTSSCKPCHICGYKNVLQECTREKDRECGTTCPVGYYYHKDNDECIECFYCCSTATDVDRVQECENIGMKKNRQCAETQKNKDCKKVADAQTTKHPSTTPTMRVIEPTTFTASMSIPTPPVSKTHYDDVNKSVGSDENNHTVGIAIGSTALALFVFLIIRYIVKKRRKRGSSKTRRRRPQGVDLQELEMAIKRKGSKAHTVGAKSTHACGRPLLKESPLESLSSSQETFAIDTEDPVAVNTRPNFELIPQDLRISEIIGLHHGKVSLGDYVTGHLDVKTPGVANWKEVGRAFRIPGYKLNLIGLAYFSFSSPTACLLETFETWGSQEPSLREFAEALYDKERTKLAEYICNWPWKLKETELESSP